METSTKEPCASSSTSEKTKGNEDTAASSSKNKDNVDSGESSKKPTSSPFDCNICLDNATDPVVSLCGHLFCWPCLHEWLMTRPVNSVCPVCKSEINKDKVVPLYGRDGKQEDPRKRKVPPRPAGQRSEPSSRNNFWGTDGNGIGGGGFQFSFGIGAFPFTFFGSTFNLGGNQQGQREAQEENVYHLFFWLAIFFLLWLVFL